MSSGGHKAAVDATGRDTVLDFISATGSGIDAFLGLEPSDAVRGVTGGNDVSLASQLLGEGRSASVVVWYAAYVAWFSVTYCFGEPVSRTAFSRLVRQHLGLATRPCGSRARGTDGLRRVQYRVFVHGDSSSAPVLPVVEALPSEPAAVPAPSVGTVMQAPLLLTSRIMAADQDRSRDIEDFLQYRQGSAFSAIERISAAVIERRRAGQLSFRAWDWCCERTRGGADVRRKLPEGVYVIEVSVPSEGLGIPAASDVDTSVAGAVRLAMLLRTPSGAHPDLYGWDEDIREGDMFGRKCLLGFVVTVSETAHDALSGVSRVREVSVEDPGMFELSPTGFSFDSDTALAILGDQAEVFALIGGEGNLVACEDGVEGHVWGVDGCFVSPVTMHVRSSQAAHETSSVGHAFGRVPVVSDLVARSQVHGEFMHALEEAESETSVRGDGHRMGDEFSSDTGERLEQFAVDTTRPMGGSFAAVAQKADGVYSSSFENVVGDDDPERFPMAPNSLFLV